jgi:hypothetical protein
MQEKELPKILTTLSPQEVERILANANEPESAFWSEFLNRVTRAKDIPFDFLMSLLDNDSRFPINNLSMRDQLLAYGLLMVYLGQKKQALAKQDVEHAEETKARYLANSRWLGLIDKQSAFPVSLVPVLAAGLVPVFAGRFEPILVGLEPLPLSEKKVKACLYAAGCLPFTIEDWIAQYGEGAVINSRNRLTIDKPLDITQITILAKALKTNITLVSCFFKSKIKTLKIKYMKINRIGSRKN